jgi:hypothetical protein
MKTIHLFSLFLCFLIYFLFAGYSLGQENINQQSDASKLDQQFEKTDQLKDTLMGFGKWSNVKISEGEDPHASGIEIEMWKHNGKLIGFLYEYVGPPADPPIGKLEDIEFDEKTGKISFRAKLTVGSVYFEKEKEWMPSKDIFIFTGTIQSDALIGEIEKRRVQDKSEVKTYEKERL